MSKDLFDIDNLKQVIFCALLMSAIDNEIHKNEWSVIQKFVSQHWKKEYGPFAQYKTKLINDLKLLLKNKQKMKDNLSALLLKLKAKLSKSQKAELLELVGNVMAADEVMTDEESNLYAEFMEKLGLQNT